MLPYNHNFTRTYNRIPAAGRRPPYGKTAYLGLRQMATGAVLTGLSLLVILSMLVGTARADIGGAGGSNAYLDQQFNPHVEKQVSLFTGAATYSYPIAVPPGTGGMQPSLALVYNSQAKWGVLGYGWSIAGLGEISRSTKKGAPKYDNTDNFVLDGNDLVRLSDANCTDTGTMWCYGAPRPLAWVRCGFNMAHCSSVKSVG